MSDGNSKFVSKYSPNVLFYEKFDKFEKVPMDDLDKGEVFLHYEKLWVFEKQNKDALICYQRNGVRRLLQKSKILADKENDGKVMVIGDLKDFSMKTLTAISHDYYIHYKRSKEKVEMEAHTERFDDPTNLTVSLEDTVEV